MAVEGEEGGRQGQHRTGRQEHSSRPTSTAPALPPWACAQAPPHLHSATSSIASISGLLKESSLSNSRLPGYALRSGGGEDATVFYYKRL